MASNVATGIRMFNEIELELVQNIIETGGMGTVGLYRLRHNREEVAVKEVVKFGLSEGDKQSLKEEASILWKIRKQCDYIVELLGILANGSKFCLILEYMKHGSITSFFRKIGNPLMVPLKMKIANQVCKGMAFLHDWDPLILHCDLKAANVLLTDDLNVKICDFGLSNIKKRVTEITLSKKKNENGSTDHTVAGTISHLAPELLDGNCKQTKKSDVYSFAILLWELMMNDTPYNGSLVEIIRRSVMEGTRPSLDNIPIKFKETQLYIIMESCWEKSPEKRPEFKEILETLSPIPPDQIEDCVARAKQEWINYNKTPVKRVADESSNSCNDTNGNSLSYFNTENLMIPNRIATTCNIPQPQLVNNEISEHEEDISSSEICISDTESQSEHNTKIENTDVIFDDPRRPILGEVNRDNVAGNIPANCCPNLVTKRKCVRVIYYSIVFLLLPLGVGVGYIIGLKHLNTVKSECNTDGMGSPNISLSCSSTDHIGKQLSPGTNCVFSCETGCELTTTYNNVTCRGTGLWSRPFPTCRTLKQCSKLLPPANDGSYQCTNDFYEQSMCNFACPAGYRLRLPNQNAVQFEDPLLNISCLSYGFDGFMWSGPEPYCEKVVTCNPLTEQDVTVTCDNPTLLSENISRMTSQQNVVNGTTCVFSCAPGSSVFGDGRTTCQDDGTWNMTTKPTCEKGCPKLSAPVNGNYHCTRDREYSSSCVFTCDKNFVLVGSENIVCQKDEGVWKPEIPPYCTCPSCWSGSDCSFSLMWSVAVSQLNSSFDFNDLQTVIYAGRTIYCGPHKLMMKKSRRSSLQMSYGCQCIDKNTNLIKQCNNPVDLYSACKTTLSSLIFILVDKNYCELPCDATDMSTRCK